MQEGRVVEQGTHDELMSHQGLYYELWTSQELGSSTSLDTKVQEPEPEKGKQKGKSMNGRMNGKK